ncbi:hypothetical protein BaRGS_00009150 [Batillaria attramentaria]|uniref:Uncharacterized protein n=1 Tax=Batillaria attramentaria TaxID=370345 RepID=A0ABD0LK00_9CAEN
MIAGQSRLRPPSCTVTQEFICETRARTTGQVRDELTVLSRQQKIDFGQESAWWPNLSGPPGTAVPRPYRRFMAGMGGPGHKFANPKQYRQREAFNRPSQTVLRFVYT